MVLTRSQAAALKMELVSSPDPDALVRKLKAQAAAQKVYDAKTADELDELADMFAANVSVGKRPEDALVEAMAKLGVGGRRRKTRKHKTKKGGKKRRMTRKH